MDMEEVKRKAKQEIEEEDFRDEVEKYKARLRAKKSFIDLIFPYKIIVIRKNKNV